MREFWDDGARQNAAWYVDTSLDYSAPDMDEFFATGRRIAGYALGGLRPRGRSVAVEIGSGLGRICMALADQFDNVIGVDISPEMVTRARQLVDCPRIRFEVGDGSTLGGVSDGSADLVLSFTVFQHLPDAAMIERYVAEAARVLRAGGVLVFQWDNRRRAFLWRVRRALLVWLQASGLRPERHRRHHPAFLGSRVRLERIAAALDRNGLSLVRTDGTGTLFAFAWAEKR